MDKIIVNAQDYFLETLNEVAVKYSLNHAPLVNSYLAGLLSKFLLSENLFITEDNHLKNPTLAFLLKDAVESPFFEQKPKYQHLGDVALYIGGVFPSSLQRSLVGVDYYIQMGSAAYQQTAELDPRSALIFHSLSQQFTKVMDLLGAVTELEPSTEKQILQLYELYDITKSPRMLQKLRNLGINPSDFSKKTQ